MTAFIKTSVIVQKTLDNILQTLGTGECYYCFKWIDKIKFETQKPECLSPEGQSFNTDTEIRWKKVGDRYRVLALSRQDLTLEGFQPLKGDWIYKDREGVSYRSNATRIPRPIELKGATIGQRYFIDRRTETIHFIALRRV